MSHTMPSFPAIGWCHCAESCTCVRAARPLVTYIELKARAEQRTALVLASSGKMCFQSFRALLDSSGLELRVHGAHDTECMRLVEAIL